MTLVEITATHLRVRATDGDTMLGGMDWTDRLTGVGAEESIEAGGVDPRDDPEMSFRLTQACETAKRTLSERMVTTLRLSCAGRDYSVDLTRSRFERATADLLQRTRDTTELVLSLIHI